jgi:hypothetical protein
LNHARRFKQISLPVLWKISQENPKQNDAIQERLQKHALRIAYEIYHASKNREDLRSRLDKTGEKVLVEQLQAWDKSKEK